MADSAAAAGGCGLQMFMKDAPDFFDGGQEDSRNRAPAAQPSTPGKNPRSCFILKITGRPVLRKNLLRFRV